MTDRKKIVDRVKKLMAMAADGSSPNEAMIAASRARKLMDEHQISINDLTDKSQFSSMGVTGSRAFTPHWENVMSVAVAKYNDCQSKFQLDRAENGMHYQSIHFRGFDEDVLVANYMLGYLIENGKRQCSKYMKEQGYTRYNASIGTAFKDGYATEICTKIRVLLNDRQKEFVSNAGTGLMVIKNQLVADHFGSVKYATGTRRDNRDQSAGQAGRDAGSRTSIHTGISGNNTKSIGGTR